MGPILPDRRSWQALRDQGYPMVPVWRRRHAGLHDPLELYRKWRSNEAFLLHSSLIAPERGGRYSFVGCQPFLTLEGGETSYRIDGLRRQGDPLEACRRLLDRYRSPRLPSLPPLVGGAVGYFAYELSRRFERLPAPAMDDLGVPDLSLLFVDRLFAFDHSEDALFSVALAETYGGARERLEEIEAILERPSPPPQPSPTEPPRSSGAWRSNFTREDYLEAIRRAKEYILAGESYQVNLSQRLTAPIFEPALSIYGRLSRIHPGCFSALLELDGFQIASGSPERLVRLDGSRILSRPIAGTRRRGRTPEEELRFRRELQSCEKERAEHAMLVDLVRNDVGRVSVPGSVRLRSTFELVPYSHVLHLESVVEGELAPGRDPMELLPALFPGGTVTGCPKVRTMEIIAELEPTARGVYTGSIGYLSFSGDLDLNIAIRTALLKDGLAHVQVGGGIVHDSVPELEYKETLNKARGLLEALGAESP